MHNHIPSPPYSGFDNLTAMRAARGYNRELIKLARAHLGAPGTLLDGGAGLGDFARAFAGPGCTVYALEPDALCRAHIATEGTGNPKDACFVVPHADIAEIPAASLDGLYSFNVLEHIEDDVGALRSWATRLRPGGRVFLYVPAFPFLFGPMDRRVGHHRRYTRESLSRLLRDAGLLVDATGYFDAAGVLATLAANLFGGTGEISEAAVKHYDTWVFPLSRLVQPTSGAFIGKNVWAAGRTPAPHRIPRLR